jgi:hypothetical protein
MSTDELPAAPDFEADRAAELARTAAAERQRQASDDEAIAFFSRKIEEYERFAAEHRKTCTKALCEDCGRHACVRCEAAPVERRGERCAPCRVASALTGSMRVPLEYVDAYRSLAARVRSAEAVKRAAKSVDAIKVVCIGPAGAGKTTLLVGMATARHQRNIERGLRESIRFYPCIALGRARAMHRLGAGDPEAIEDAKCAGLLLLDDVGAEASRDSDVISEIIHARHDAAAPTWCTTGLSPEEIAIRYSGGIERRLFERAVVLDCGGTKR